MNKNLYIPTSSDGDFWAKQSSAGIPVLEEPNLYQGNHRVICPNIIEIWR